MTTQEPTLDTNADPDTIKATVVFPISSEPPFHADEQRSTPVSDLLQAAMQHFHVAADAEHTYYFTHKGMRIADGTPVGDVAEHANAVQFTLVKELIQG